MNQIVALEQVKVSSLVCWWFKWQSPIWLWKTSCGSRCRRCLGCPAWTHYSKSRPFISAVCLHWGWQFQDSQLPPFFPPSASSFIFLSFFSIIFLFWIFPPAGAPCDQKASLLQSQQEAKLVHSAAVPLGACCISVPGFLSGAIQRGWWKDTIHKKRKK